MSLLGSAEGTLECGSASYRRSLDFQGGSFAAALHDLRNARKNPPATCYDVSVSAEGRLSDWPG